MFVFRRHRLRTALDEDFEVVWDALRAEGYTSPKRIQAMSLAVWNAIAGKHNISMGASSMVVQALILR